jgi:hypothetical protein
MLICVILSCCLIVTGYWRHIVHLLVALLLALLALGVIQAGKALTPQPAERVMAAPMFALEGPGPVID